VVAPSKTSAKIKAAYFCCELHTSLYEKTDGNVSSCGSNPLTPTSEVTTQGLTGLKDKSEKLRSLATNAVSCKVDPQKHAKQLR